MLAEDTGDEDEDEDAAPADEEEDTDSDADDADLEQWTLFGAMWFSWTLITSIGYGSYAPNSVAGQWVRILTDIYPLHINFDFPISFLCGCMEIMPVRQHV